MYAKPLTQKLVATTAIVFLLISSVPTSTASNEIARIIKFLIKLAVTGIIDDKIRRKYGKKYEKKTRYNSRKIGKSREKVLDTSHLRSPLAKIFMSVGKPINNTHLVHPLNHFINGKVEGDYKE